MPWSSGARMAVPGAPPQCEIGAMERVKMSVRAQTFLDVLQGAFQSTWGRPEEVPQVMSQAMSELSASEEAKAGLRYLLSYLEALSPCLSRLCGVSGQEGEAAAASRGKRRRKPMKPQAGAGGGGSSLPSSADEEETASEQGLSTAALGQDDKMDTDVGEAVMRRDDEARLLVPEDSGMGVARGVVRAGVSASRSSMGRRRGESSVQGVLGDRDLLGYVLAFVGGETGRQSVRALGQVGLVCRLWRVMASWGGQWLGVGEEVAPALWRDWQGHMLPLSRGPLALYGQQLLMGKRLWSENDWAEGLELHVEVFDRMDGLQMLSAKRPLVCSPDEDGDVQLYLPANPLVEVRCSSFSAASRDPEQQRFSDIQAYFNEGHSEEYPCSLCVRVTILDRRTRRGGVLWEEGKGTKRSFDVPIPHWEERLPQGAEPGVVCSKWARMVGAQGHDVQYFTNMYVIQEPDQEGVAVKDRLYRVAMAADNSQRDSHPFRLFALAMETHQVGAVIRSLC